MIRASKRSQVRHRFPVVNEVTDAPDVWVFYNYVRNDLYLNQVGFDPQPEPILRSISEQTGLTFVKEKRRGKMLTLERAREN